MKVKIRRFLSATAVRALCIRYHLYTKGTNAEYEAMLDKCPTAESDDAVLAIAADIIKHSDDEKADLPDADTNMLSGLVWMLAATCTEVRVEVLPQVWYAVGCVRDSVPDTVYVKAESGIEAVKVLSAQPRLIDSGSRLDAKPVQSKVVLKKLDKHSDACVVISSQL